MSAEQRQGFFTLGVSAEQYNLPHPRLGLPIVFLIRCVLLRAFEILREQKFNLAAAKEDEVTAALRAVVENELRQTGAIPGFDRRTYDTVVRQGQVTDYSGSCLTKTPDLCFKLRSDDYEARRPVISEYDALFVECKPVDSTHAAGGKYCDDGLIRFVRGDYAWAMQEGMMLAYVRDGRTIASHLIPVMQESTRIASLATAQLPQACPAPTVASSDAETVHISQHRRGFPWPDGKGQACDITVYHLWHRCG